METKKILENLCYHDKRNPYHLDIEDFDEFEILPRNNCMCDNCFYGRDELAMYILELMNIGRIKKL